MYYISSESYEIIGPVRRHSEDWTNVISPDIKDLQPASLILRAVMIIAFGQGYGMSLHRLGLTTLQTRRERGDLIEVHKIITGKEKIE
jgi:hypothetical protein